MITVTYQKPAQLNPNSLFTVRFDSEAEYRAWERSNPSFVVCTVERSGNAAASRLNSIFGGGK